MYVYPVCSVAQAHLTLENPMGCHIACWSPLSMGFPRQEYSSGLPFYLPGDLHNPGFKPMSPVLQADSLPLYHLVLSKKGHKAPGLYSSKKMRILYSLGICVMCYIKYAFNNNYNYTPKNILQVLNNFQS